MDWSKLGCFLLINVKNLNMEIIKLAEIYIINDICQHDDFFYVVDKLQGKIFSYDKSFKFRSKRLSSGQEPGKLYDPISIFSDKKKLHVLSWLNKYIVKLIPF